MNQQGDLSREGLKTPRAAAIAGIVFSLLLMASMFLLLTSLPPDPLAAATDVIRHSKRISLAIDLLPFACIAFLWFVGVVRDRLGKHEDRFFATVFFGSALLFVAAIFIAGSLAGAIVRLLESGPESLIGSGAYSLARMQIYQTMHTYAIKMAGVFMISTATISLRTGIFPRWMAFLGYALALTLLLSVGTINGILLLFPLWVLAISVYILIDNLRAAPELAAASAKE
jgi:hypothetical protein